MDSPIISSKLFIPSPRLELVSRSRLIQKLNQASSGKFTLISAQAGSGKTTLLAEWIDQCKQPVCWLSLDENDNEPQKFLQYLIASLQSKIIGLDEVVFIDNKPPTPLEINNFLTRLINKISTLKKTYVLVLDDFHVITDTNNQQLCLFLLDHLPPQLHLIISSRSDPPWPLSRFRVRGDVYEIRSNDMRFTTREAFEYLNDVMGLALTTDDVTALERRTEGWIVGLQLAAVSIKHRPDKKEFIQAFTGSHRYIVDYLVEEVLDLQPDHIREFLLRTSILSRLSGSLCDALLERNNSQKIINDLEQMNMFIIPLDDERRWYRYHRLFSDLLKHHLYQNSPHEIVDLHLKASAWYEDQNLFADALSHALKSKNTDRILQLTNGITVYKLDYGELKELLSWVENLPDLETKKYPWIIIIKSWALFNLGRYDDVNANLDKIDEILSTQPVPSDLANRMNGHAAAIRSYLAELREEPRVAMMLAKKALKFLPHTDIKLRAFVSIRLANCLAWLGHFSQAIEIYQDVGESTKHAGEAQLAISALSEIGSIQMLCGNTRLAESKLREVSLYAETLSQRDGRQLPAIGILYRHISYVKRETNELSDAEHYCREAINICRQWGEKESYLFALMALARVQYSQGEYSKLASNFTDIMQIAAEISPEYEAQFNAWIIQYYIQMGDIQKAEDWLQTNPLSASDDFGYDRHQEYQNFARYLIAIENYKAALQVVTTLLKATNDVEAGMYINKYKLLQAIILFNLNRQDLAITLMEEVLAFVQKEGCIRLILDERLAVPDLLQLSISRGVQQNFASEVLSAINLELRSLSLITVNSDELLEPLSQRELEVLRLFLTDLSVPDIAAKLTISANTVRSHIKNIYSKLNVHNRFEAVHKAKDLNIL